MRKVVICTLCCVFLGSSAVFAVSTGKTIEFSKSPLGTVTFSGDTHNKSVASCKECHKEGDFPKMKQGAVKITMSDIVAGKYCGVCHNGVKAFEAKANCERCHVKKLL